MQCAHFAFRAVCRTSLAKRFIFHSPKVLFTENGIECSQGISPYEHSIFLFYVQRYTQTPDLAVNSDPQSGANIAWTLSTGSALIYTAPYTSGEAQTVEASPVLTKDGNILIAASSGKIFTVSPDGETLKTIDTGAPIFGSPAVENDRIYVSDFSGRVSCIAY